MEWENPFVKVYHGSSGPREITLDLRMYGPSESVKPTFYVTPQQSVARNFAGPGGTVLEYNIPKYMAEQILGSPKSYMGVGGGTCHTVCNSKKSIFKSSFIS